MSVQMQSIAINMTTQTKMRGSGYERLLLVNMVAKCIPEHTEERVAYIHLPTRQLKSCDGSFQQAGQKIINNNYYSRYFPL